MFDDDSSPALAAQLTLLVEATGSTDFFEVGDTYFLYPEGAAPLQLKASGAAVMDGQLGAWQPIAAEQAGSGYQVAWKLGGNVWIWDVDSGGNYVSNAVFAHGGQWALQSAETSFGQDLNGDGFVGLITTAIEASGATRLYEVADAYFLYPEGGSPVGLKVGGAMVAEGQLGAWQPIAAEQVGSGYQVAWKLGGNVWIWDVDSGGDYVSNAVFAHGSQWALQSAEPGFGQDLNGDGFVGPITTAIEASGATRLYDVADAYFLYPEGGSPVGLKVGGAMVAEGQLGAWQPIAAEQVGSGYQVAWKLGGNIWIWDVDSGGNYVSNAVFAHGSQWALQSAEPGFGQDLNGDGFVGPITTAIEASGATRLYDVADAYFLYPEGGSPVGLKVGGAMVAEGQLGAWQPIAAEQAGSGYQVAWKLGGNIWIWDVDSAGNYLSNGLFANGSQWALQSAETSFGQDLNGDGVVGTLTTAIEASGQTRLYDVADAFFLYPGNGSPVSLKVGGVDGGGKPARPLAADCGGAGRRWLPSRPEGNGRRPLHDLDA